MATIRNQWLKISKENYPDWWQAGQVVRVAPYDNGKAFVLMPTNEQRRIPGYSKISIKGYLYSAAFIDGDYKIIPHDGSSIIIYPVKAEDKESGDNDAPDIDESKAELDIDLNNCTTEQALLWTRGLAGKYLQSGRIPKEFVSTAKFFIETTEQVMAKSALPAISDHDSLKALREMAQDKTISESVRSGILKELLKRESQKGKRERKTIVMETKGQKNADSSR